MLNGDNIKERIRIYNQFCEYNHKENNINGILVNWINVFEDINNNIILGITDTGKWIFAENNMYYMLDDLKSFLYCSNLLEYSFESIINCLNDRFDFCKDNRIIYLLFPFQELFVFVGTYLINDYWFELAWNWFDQFPIDIQYSFIDLIIKLKNDNRLSQSNRQKASKFIKRLSKTKI